MKKIIDAFYDARGIDVDMRKNAKKEIEKIAKEKIEYFDKNGDDLIDVNEFIDGSVANLAFYSPIYFLLNDIATDFFNITE